MLRSFLIASSTFLFCIHLAAAEQETASVYFGQDKMDMHYQLQLKNESKASDETLAAYAEELWLADFDKWKSSRFAEAPFVAIRGAFDIRIDRQPQKPDTVDIWVRRSFTLLSSRSTKFTHHPLLSVRVSVKDGRNQELMNEVLPGSDFELLTTNEGEYRLMMIPQDLSHAQELSYIARHAALTDLELLGPTMGQLKTHADVTLGHAMTLDLLRGWGGGGALALCETLLFGGSQSLPK